VGALATTPAWQTVVEVSRLLDDVLEAASRIAWIINKGAFDDSRLWHEVAREVNHIRDHYDCVEEIVLDCLRPAD
jgi:hypothetical protein